MEKGRRFSSFEEFNSKFQDFCREANVLFVKRSSEAMKDTTLSHIKYESIVFVCKQGRPKHEKASTGIRPCQKSLKVGCPAKLRLRAIRSRDSPPQLVITVSELDHANHDVTADACQLLPENRRVAMDAAAKLLLSCGTAKPQEVKSMLEKEQQRMLLPSDVYNARRRVLGTRGDLEECEQLLEEIKSAGGVVNIGCSDTGDLQYLFIMTAMMRRIVVKYPEVVILDSTYKTNKYLYPLFTAMVIDGEGHGVPVMHAYLGREDRASLEHCLKLFANQYTFASTKCFVVDKDMAEISALQAVFPETPVNLCSFHIHQAVKRFLKKELPSDSVDTVLDMFMSMVYTESEEEFDSIKSRLSEIVPQSVSEYFRVNWWEKGELWAACLNVNVIKLHASTTNHLESYHGKIKKLLNEKLTLASSLKELVRFDDSKIADCQRKLLIKANSVCYDQRDSDETSKAITSCLTKFAADITKGQLSCARKTCYEISLLHYSLFSVAYREKSHQTTAESCSCSFFNHMMLPCRHIFALRAHLGISLFCNQLVPERFLLSDTVTIVDLPGESSLLAVATPSHSFRTQEGRYLKAKSVCDSITTYLSILGVDEFSEKIAQLEGLMNLWNSSEESLSPSHALSTVPVGVLDSTSLLSSDVRPSTPPASSFVRASSPLVSAVVGPTSPPPIVLTVVSASSIPSPPVSSVVGTSFPPVSSVVGTSFPPVSSVVGTSFPPVSSVVRASSPPVSSVFRASSPPVSSVFRASSPPVSSVVRASSPPVASPMVVHPASPLPASSSSVILSSDPLSLAGVKLARLNRPRGRPCNRQRFTLKRKRVGPLKFDALSLVQKQEIILNAVCKRSVNTSSGTVLTLSDLRHYTEFLDTVMDCSIDLSLVQPFFDDVAWNSLREGVVTRKEDGLFKCGDCGDFDDLSQKMIMCEKCLQWFHFPCAGYRSKMKVPTWFCQPCFSGC